MQRLTAVGALAISILSLVLSTWATVRTLEYSSLTSEPHVKAYLVGILPVPRTAPPGPEIVYCQADIRLANTGGAGAILESIDVTVRVGTNSATQHVDAVREYTHAVENEFVGSTSLTSYAANSTFPLLVRPYDVAEITDLTAELQNESFEFVGIDSEPVAAGTSPPAAVARDASATEVGLSFLLHFADGAEMSVPEKRCTWALASG